MENNFVHLNLHTEYSLSEGVNSIDSFLVKAKELGMTSLAVTDYANMFCAVEFYQKAKKMGIKPIIGLELPIFNKDEQNIFSLTLLAKNYNGYKNLVKLASELYKKNAIFWSFKFVNVCHFYAVFISSNGFYWENKFWNKSYCNICIYCCCKLC